MQRYALGLLVSLFISSHLSASWRRETAAELRLISLQLSADNPTSEREDLLSNANARLQYFKDDNSQQYRHELGLSYGTSLESGEDYQSFNGRSTIVFPQSRSNHSLSLGGTYIRGSDPIGQALEQLAAEEADDFLGLQLSYGHQRELSPRDAIRIELGLARNEQADFRILSQEAQLAYIYRFLRTWSSTWRLRLTQQQAPPVEDNQIAELANDHIWTLSPAVSLEAGVGFSTQRQGDQQGQGLLYLAALNYQSQSLEEIKELDKEGEPDASQSKAGKRSGFEQAEDNRGASLVRLGWTRSRDQRRLGDPFFVADQAFLTWTIGLSPRQALQFDLRQTQATDGPQSGLRESTGSAAYRLRHDYSIGPSSLAGQFGAEASLQRTENLGRNFERVLYTLLYGLTF